MFLYYHIHYNGACMGGLRRFAFLTFLVILNVTILSSYADGGIVFYVSNSGSNTVPHLSWETAAWSLGSVVPLTGPGDTIRIGAGVYTEVDSIRIDRDLTIIGSGMDSTELKGPDGIWAFFITYFGNLSIESISVTPGTNGNTHGILHFGDNDDSLKLNSCRFYKFETAILSSIGFCYVANCVFDECAYASGPVCYMGWGSGNSIFENNTFEGTYGLGGGRFINLEANWNADSIIVRRNIFRGSGYPVINVANTGLTTVENNLFLSKADEFAYPAPYLGSSRVFVVRNNLFWSSTPSTEQWQMYIVDPTDGLITNNICISNNPGIGLFFEDNRPLTSLVEVSYNDFYLTSRRPPLYILDDHFDVTPIDSIYCTDSNYVTPIGILTTQGNLCVEPMIADTFDFFLQFGSPCIDAGNPAILDPDGSRSDIGPFGGSAGTVYAYQDLPPAQPQGFAGSRSGDTIRLSWDKNAESDLRHYAVYAGTLPGIPLNSIHLVDLVESSPSGIIKSSYLDTSRIEHTVVLASQRSSLFYTVVAVDHSSLVSLPAQALEFVLTSVDEEGEEVLPVDFSLDQNYPNPFNATTAIVYSLPNIGAQPASVRLTIYNSLGQQVRSLVDQHQFPGRQVAYWDGFDNSGNAVASGIYFYTLQISGIDFIKSKKMLLLK